MQAGGVAGVATRIAVQLPEKRELNWVAPAGARPVVSAVARTAARDVRVYRVVSISGGVWSRDHFADFGQNGRRGAAAGSGCGIEYVPQVCDYRAHLCVGSGIFI